MLVNGVKKNRYGGRQMKGQFAAVEVNSLEMWQKQNSFALFALKPEESVCE